MVSVMMEFPGNRLAQFTCSFGAEATAAYDLVGTKGCLRLESAYEYTEPMTMTLTIQDKTTTKKYSKQDQFAAELEYFSNCIQNHETPEASGREGLADLRVLEAIEESLRKNKPVHLSEFEKDLRPDESQIIEFPAVSKPKPIRVKSPHS
jgi:glucose-fructose oxidoreductase